MTQCNTCGAQMNNLGGPDADHQLLACPGPCFGREAGATSEAAYKIQTLAEQALAEAAKEK